MDKSEFFQHVFQTVQIVISEHAAVEQEQVTLNTPIFASMRLPCLSVWDAGFSGRLPRANNNPEENPLGLDELDEIGIISAIEEKVNIYIPEQALYDDIYTVKALVDYIIKTAKK